MPGTFGCKDLGLARSDEIVAAKLELYLEWAESDDRIAGFNPWHLMGWNPAKPPEGPKAACGMVAGAVSLPKAMAVLRRIGLGIVENTRSHPPTPTPPRHDIVKLSFAAPVNVLNGLPEHADHFYSIPASELQGSTPRTLFGAVETNGSGLVTAVSRDGAVWGPAKGVEVSGQLFQHNATCLHTLGAIYDIAGPASLHGTFSPTRSFTSNYSDAYCASGDGKLTQTREAKPVVFRGLPFNVISMTTGLAKAPFVSRSVRHALLTPRVNPRSLYRAGKSSPWATPGA